jgi:hypothetical protein
VRASVGFAGLDAVVLRTLAAWIVRQLQLRIDGACAVGDERQTALWLNALGGLYLNRGMHGDAVRLLEEAVEIRKRVLGPKHAYCLPPWATWPTRTLARVTMLERRRGGGGSGLQSSCAW